MTNPYGILVAIFGHVLNGAVSITDKFLLTKSIRHPAAFTFWISFLSLGTFVLLPFGFGIPQGMQWVVTLLGGATFTLALYFFYVAIKSEEVSRVVPIVGSLIPILTIFLSYFYLGERLKILQIVAIITLILGIIVLTYKKSHIPINIKLITAAPIAAIFFAVSSVLMKEVFLHQPFFAGLAWSRFGGFLTGFLFLAWQKNRQAIFEKAERPTGKKLVLFIIGRIASASAFILINLGITLTSPTIVNALHGFEYAFLFGATLLFSKFWPQILKEPVNRSVIIIKLFGICIIIIGSIILSL